MATARLILRRNERLQSIDPMLQFHQAYLDPLSRASIVKFLGLEAIRDDYFNFIPTNPTKHKAGRMIVGRMIAGSIQKQRA